VARFRARDLREGTGLDELRRTLNEIQKELAQDIGQALTRVRVTEIIIDGPYAARYGDVVRVAPPAAGLRVILPPKNLEQPGARVVVVVEGSTGALSVEAVDATVNGADTVTYLAGLGTLEFQLTPTGWYGWSASLNTVPLTSLAAQASDTVVANVTAGTAPPTAVGLSTLAGAGLAFAAHTLDVTGSTSITVTSDQVQRAALTGAVAATLNSNATLFAGIRDNGSAENDRSNLNFLSSTSVVAVVTDDAGNDELELTWERAALTGEATAGANSNAVTVTRSTDFNTSPWTGPHNFEDQLLLGTEQTDAGTGSVNVTLGNVIRLRFTSAAGNITLGTVSGCAEGRVLLVEFSGTGTHTVTHGSSAVNSFDCPNDVNLVMTGRCGFIAVGRGGTPAWKVLATTN
jgi:hypothetical protein